MSDAENQSKEYLPPLTVSFVWCPSDQERVNPILNALRSVLTRDVHRPFSRGLNIPFFLFSSLGVYETPIDKPRHSADRNLIFVFTSVNTLGHKIWKDYVESLPNDKRNALIPVALDKYGLGHAGSLHGINCIRSYEWPEEYLDLYSIIYLSHEINRFGLVKTDEEYEGAGSHSSITIFLSHAKAGDTGRVYSEKIKKFIDNTNMNRFFDANEIAPGYMFEEEIKDNVNRSTLVAIESDLYSSRYWCQREILIAKELDRPVIVVNCLEDFEDRIFPAASNVPCVHITPSPEISDKDVLRILSSAIIESVRFGYSSKSLEAYKDAGWLDADCALSARPPELRQVLKLQKRGVSKICYPEPPIYSEEGDWHQYLGVTAYTPLWTEDEEDCLAGQAIGLSISEFKNEGYAYEHIPEEALVRLSQDLARHLMARSAILHYGGDLRPGGFTEFILDEARILNSRVGSSRVRLVNHLAWPLHIEGPKVVSWRASYHDVMQTVEHDIPPPINETLDDKVFIPPTSARNLYVWARCLTKMRRESIGSSTVRVCVGGRRSGYKGQMPGVLEEIMFSIEMKKPIFLLGGFGGIASDVCSVIRGESIPDSLTENWQIAHNDGYIDVQAISKNDGVDTNFSAIVGQLERLSVSELAGPCGLDESEYLRLMTSPFIDECVRLIILGLRRIQDAS